MGGGRAGAGSGVQGAEQGWGESQSGRQLEQR